MKGIYGYMVEFDTFRLGANAGPLMLAREIDGRAMFLLMVMLAGWSSRPKVP